MCFPCEAYPGSDLLKKRKWYENKGVVYHKIFQIVR